MKQYALLLGEEVGILFAGLIPRLCAYRIIKDGRCDGSIDTERR